jgi:hypothetical protein
MERIEHNPYHNENEKQNRTQELAQNLPQSLCDIFESQFFKMMKD